MSDRGTEWEFRQEWRPIKVPSQGSCAYSSARRIARQAKQARQIYAFGGAPNLTRIHIANAWHLRHPEGHRYQCGSERASDSQRTGRWRTMRRRLRISGDLTQIYKPGMIRDRFGKQAEICREDRNQHRAAELICRSGRKGDDAECEAALNC